MAETKELKAETKEYNCLEYLCVNEAIKAVSDVIRIMAHRMTEMEIRDLLQCGDEIVTRAMLKVFPVQGKVEYEEEQPEQDDEWNGDCPGDETEYDKAVA